MTTDPTGRLVSTGPPAPVARAEERLPENLDADRVARILSVTGGLPPVPPVAAEVVELVGRADTSVGDLERVVSSDRALAARILATANSVFYSFDQKISALSHAIVILGFPAVQSMAIADASRRLFRRAIRFGTRGRSLWDHSIGCAMSCRQIARVVGYAQEETAFVTGLLHDVGKAVLNDAVPEKYGRIVEIVELRQRPFAEVENDMLGFDHSHLGALIAREWTVSGDGVDTIARHHVAGDHAKGGDLAAILAISNDLSRRGEPGTPRTGETPGAATRAARALPLDDETCRRVREMVAETLEEERRLYEL